MTRNDKDTINKRTENRHLFRRMKAGITAAKATPHKAALVLAYLLGAVLVWLLRSRLFHLDTYGMFSPVLGAAINLLVPLYAVGGLLAVLVLLGTPWGGKATREGLQKVGLINHAGEAPILLSKYHDANSARLTVWEFDPCGIPLNEWEDKKARIETALNIIIAKMAWGEGRKIIQVYAVPAASDLPSLLQWKDEYLSPDNFVLTLGESLMGPVQVNLNQIPHILLAAPRAAEKAYYSNCCSCRLSRKVLWCGLPILKAVLIIHTLGADCARWYLQKVTYL